jgi:hypothetical protein
LMDIVVDIDGATVGVVVGVAVWFVVGSGVGDLVGAAAVGALVGATTGAFVGAFVGLFVGLFVGAFVGAVVGASVGDRIGVLEGAATGAFIGATTGAPEGAGTGALVGASVGAIVRVVVGIDVSAAKRPSVGVTVEPRVGVMDGGETGRCVVKAPEGADSIGFSVGRRLGPRVGLDTGSFEVGLVVGGLPGWPGWPAVLLVGPLDGAWKVGTRVFRLGCIAGAAVAGWSVWLAGNPAVLVGSGVVEEGDRVGYSSDDREAVGTFGFPGIPTPSVWIAVPVDPLDVDWPHATLSKEMAKATTIQMPRAPSTKNLVEENRLSRLVWTEPE